MHQTPDLNSVRKASLDRIERAESHYKLAFVGAAAAEAAFLIGFLLLADFANRLHLLLLLATVAVYSIVALGLFALGAHVSRSTRLVLKAVEQLAERDPRGRA